MDTYKETFETWNKVAQSYQDKFMDLDLYNNTYDTFCAQLNKTNAAILEIGCGPGNITKYLLSKNPDFKITAIDIAPNMIELAKINNPTAIFLIMDSREINKIETTFDAIICGFCLPYLSELDVVKMIKDCAHLLNNNGILYLSFVEGAQDKSGFVTGSTGDRAYFYYHTIDALNKELKGSHFETTNLLHTNYSKNDGTKEVHTIIIAKKLPKA